MSNPMPGPIGITFPKPGMGIDPNRGKRYCRTEPIA